MAVTFDSITWSTNPENPEINNDTFITAPMYSITLKYYTNTADDDVAATVSNSYQPIGSPDLEENRSDFNIFMGSGSGSFVGDEVVGVLDNTPLPALALSTLSGNFWRNMMIKIEYTPVPIPPPAKPIFQLSNKLASGSSTPILFNQITSSATNPIPAGTRIFAPKILKTVTFNMYFASMIIKSGIYRATISFQHMFSGQVIKAQEIVIRYSENEAGIGGGVPKSFTQHQWGYVYKNLDYADTGRLILTHDMPTVFSKADQEFSFKIHLRGFSAVDNDNIINDSFDVKFTPKTNLNPLDEDSLAKEIEKRN
ncbi:MAG TPA: hypothetical protein PKI46_00560 [Bacteroidales bacterium]|nr:hypothetical protein [Bacteroidales bacterium]